jgi:hypothetical protein
VQQERSTTVTGEGQLMRLSGFMPVADELAVWSGGTGMTSKISSRPREREAPIENVP